MNRIIVSFCVLGLLLTSCSMNYSFTGTSLSPDIKTVSVGYFRNVAPLVNPRLSNQLTESLKDKLLSETRLRMKQDDGDLVYEGEITGYSQTYDGVQANEVAAQNKLTITINVKYTNNIEPLRSFEKQFSRFAVFSSSENIDAIEDKLVKQIVDELLIDVFSATVADW